MAIVNKWINTRFFCSKPYKNGVITTSAPLKGGPLSMALQRLGNWGAKTLLMCMKYHPIYNDPWGPTLWLTNTETDSKFKFGLLTIDGWEIFLLGTKVPRFRGVCR